MTVQKQRADFTYKNNLGHGRHGWVRLTPAYSVTLVEQILDEHGTSGPILEPFCGTGTTGLAAAQRGMHCDLYDINPFLLWLARVKCANYTPEQIYSARAYATQAMNMAHALPSDAQLWVPPISHIERWWPHARLMALARLFHGINSALPQPCPEKDLLLVAFCRSLIQWSNAAFNHQSMSFKAEGSQLSLFETEAEPVIDSFMTSLKPVLESAAQPISGSAAAYLHDSRKHPAFTPSQGYSAVITSPPYVNRMSYIRELRPYMYWLGYLSEARQAGELDWQAIGGTWGIATSRLSQWEPAIADGVPQALNAMVRTIASSSDVLARYVHKYFIDMNEHFAMLRAAVAPGGQVFYIIGNSKFFDTLVPAETIYAEMLRYHGFVNVRVTPLRKRNSKKELIEFLVTGTQPSSHA